MCDDIKRIKFNLGVSDRRRVSSPYGVGVTHALRAGRERQRSAVDVGGRRSRGRGRAAGHARTQRVRHRRRRGLEVLHIYNYILTNETK